MTFENRMQAVAESTPVGTCVRDVVKPGRTKVVVIQDDLFQYREAFFDRLVTHHGIDLTVAHYGTPKASSEVAFSEHTALSLGVGAVTKLLGLNELIEKADVVIAICNPKRINTLLLSRRRRRYRLILWGHHLGRSAVLGRVRRAMIERADAMVLYDSANVNEVAEKGVDKRKLFVVPNTIHVPNAQFDSTASRDSFLFVGRLRPRKGIDEFLRAFATLKSRSDKPIFATVIGSGRELTNLERLASNLGVIDRVRFVPGTSDPDILLAEFRRALAYVSPLHVGLGVLHSFGYGVPVITLRERRHAPEVHNCVHEVNSFLCDHQFTVTDAMQTLVDNPLRSIEMGKHAFQHYAENRRIDQMAAAMSRVIRFVTGDDVASEVAR